MATSKTINTKQLRDSLKEIVRDVRRGERFLVLYRSRPAFRIVPIDQTDLEAEIPLEMDPIYRAGPVGRSADGQLSVKHDRLLYDEGEE